MFKKRIQIICGHYGSGKSEIAVNMAKKIAESSVLDKRVLLDLDIINPYFRSIEKKAKLESVGVKVFSGSVEGNNQDLPSIPRETRALIYDDKCDLIIDLGGEDTGARVIASYRDELNEKGYDMFLVLNCNRQETDSLSKALKYIDLLENASNLKITGIISNSHLLSFTEVSDIIKGYELSKEVSEKTNIPIVAVTCKGEFVEALPEKIKKLTFPLEIELREAWMN